MVGAAGFEPGGRYRNYVIEKLLGQGGMSAVYEARHELTGRLAAIKVMVSRGSRSQADPQALERFRREAEFLCRLEHPNLPAIYDMEVLPDGTGVIVMEHLEGRDLGELLREQHRLTPVETLGIAIEVVKPLAFAHNHGIVHRDLKPGNVFICSGTLAPGKGRVRVLDFGIAKHKYSKGITREHVIIGTVSYMSPEQLMGQTDRIDGASDQYSLGAMLYQALAGHPLFIKPGDEVPNPTLLCYWHISREVPDLREELPWLPDDAWRIVARLLEKKPEARYAKTEDLFDDLVAVQRKLLAEKRGQSAASDTGDANAASGRATEPDELDRAQRFRPVAEPAAFAQGVAATTLAQGGAPRALAQGAAPPQLAKGPAPPGPEGFGSMGPATVMAIAQAALNDGMPGAQLAPPVDPAALKPAVAHAAAQPTMTRPALAPPSASAPPEATAIEPAPSSGSGWVEDIASLRKQLSGFMRDYLAEHAVKEPAAARELMHAALAGDDPSLRLAAASELGTYGDARSLAAVRAAVEQEQAPVVALLLETTLGELQARFGGVAPVAAGQLEGSTQRSAGWVAHAGAWLRGVAATNRAQAIVPGHMLVVRAPGGTEQRWLLRAEPGDQIELGAADAPDPRPLVLLVASHADYHVRPREQGVARIVRPDGTVSMDEQAPGGRLRVGDVLEPGAGLRVWLEAVPAGGARLGSEIVEPWRAPDGALQPERRRSRWMLWAGVAASVLLLVLLGVWLLGGR